ncbi:PhoH family protein [Desulforhopalus vacuolatus]|uniref:PhoH family protein n=1 Tax=Desulforhopalus vacuolatus TaxID=40414 RepID=UPI001964A5BF|nr:PhoH family protein [Desulforhopalus vacuolatus]MBM9519776.1 PhoH family protein [Desulforhopalus vacuolatus]
MKSQTTRVIEFSDNTRASTLYGDLNKNLQMLEKSAGVSLQARGSHVRITGLPCDVDLTAELLQQLYDLLSCGYPLYSADIAFGLKILQGNPDARLDSIFLDKIYVTTRNRIISPKTPNQKRYIDALRNNDIVFGIGPAGTGKTYLAVAMAVAALTSGRVQSIILTRPAVEAGEKLGFLPGDLAQKVNPYLRPLLDALAELLGAEKTIDMMEEKIIEIAPLAFMRGRTLTNAFIILDEAQNTTREQMKMFLTRIGFDSVAVITGDITQIDLPNHAQSGLIEAQKLLNRIPGLEFCAFGKEDVVRHPLVQKIINAYEQK